MLNKRIKILAVILLIFTLLAVKFAELKVKHDCTGEDCQVCFVIEVIEQNIKLLSLTFGAVIILDFKRFSEKPAGFNILKIEYSHITLISQKIRLNN